MKAKTLEGSEIELNKEGVTTGKANTSLASIPPCAKRS